MARSKGSTTRSNDLVGANPADEGLAHMSNVIIRRSS